MTITRDVIYDLLPAYFSGEVTSDTRMLVEEFFENDPEFGRMAERFRTLSNDRTTEIADSTSSAASERTTLERARRLMKRRNQAFGGAIAYGVAAFFILILANPLHPPMPQRLVATILVLVAIQLASWANWYWAVRELSSIGRIDS